MKLRLAGLTLSLAVLISCAPESKNADSPEPAPPTFEAPVPTFTPSFDDTTAPATTTGQVAPSEPPTEEVAAIESPALVDSSGSPLLAAIATLPIAEENYADRYDRNLFGGAWIDADADGCNTRCEVLKAERVALPGGAMGWLSLYDNYPITKESELDIDHMVALAEAWRSGAWAWEPSRRIAFANDLDEPGALIAVTAVTNRAKGASDPANWKPANIAAWCDYADAWVATKRKWDLTADPAEVAALRDMVTAQSC